MTLFPVVFFSFFFPFNNLQWFEVVQIFFKMIMTGAMVMIAPGHPVQSLIATLLLLFYMLLLLKCAPYTSNTEDWTSFLCSFTLTLTTLTGFAMHALTDPNDPNDPTSLLFGAILIVINVTCLVVNLGIAVLFDMGFYEKIGGKKIGKIKVVPSTKVRTWS